MNAPIDIKAGQLYLRESIKRLERNPLFVLVEDDANDVILIQREINTYFKRCHIVTCRTAEEAVKVLAVVKADAVFVDLCLPNMDGIGLIKVIKEKYQMAVIVVTGLLESGVLAMEALKSGVVSIIAKPVSQADLKNIFEPL